MFLKISVLISSRNSSAVSQILKQFYAGTNSEFVSGVPSETSSETLAEN